MERTGNKDGGELDDPAEAYAVLSTYIPEWLLRRALADPAVLRPEAGVRTLAAVAFADIAGFTALAERLAATGREGAEELTALLNRAYTALLGAAATHGGSVAHFSGDAMTILFPARTSTRIPRHQPGDLSLAPAILRAVRGARAMQTAFAPFQTLLTGAGTVHLTMEVGISAGSLLTGVVGQPEIGLEFVVAGRAVDRAAAAEHNATPGSIHLDSDLLVQVAGQVTLGPGDAISRPVLAVTRPRLQAAGHPRHAPVPLATRLALVQTLRPFLPSSEGDGPGWSPGPGEHRRVSTAFVGFSGLDYDHDPYALHKLQLYVTAVQTVVRRFGGRVNRVLTGDKGSVLHLLFGAPVAHEDDTARAMRAALAIRDECPLPFSGDQRIGITTGAVFAGALGSASRREYTVLGTPVNLAARLTEAAAPGQILLDSSSVERVGTAFRLDPVPPLLVRGLADPIPVWSLVGEAQPEADAVLRYFMGDDERLPLVGRANEWQQIATLVRAAQDGKGQVLAITGEAGMGKSRLSAELLRAWLLAGGSAYAGSAQAYGGEPFYQPWVELLRAFCDLRPGQSAAQQRARLAERVADLAPEHSDDGPLLGQLLGVATVELPDVPPDYSWMRSTALSGGEISEDQLRSARRNDLILALLRAEARRRPLLLVLDGLQWADAASLALIDALARDTADHALLLCLESRNDLAALPALHHPNAHQLALQELPPSVRLELLATMAARKGQQLPPTLAAQIAERSGGNPFFMEELLAGIDSNAAGAEADPADVPWSRVPRRTDATNTAPEGDSSAPPSDRAGTFPLPDTIEGVLMARLDRLSNRTRELVRTAAVLGTRLPVPLVRALVPGWDEEGVQAALAEGVRADLWRPDAGAALPTYRFKHNLIGAVAYGSLAYAQRRQLHGVAGAAVEDLYAATLGDHYATLAYHYARSDHARKGRLYLEKAGDRAAALFALSEAVAYYVQALAPARWPELEGGAEAAPPEVLLEQIGLYRKLGRTQARSGDYTGAETTLQQALAICPVTAWEERGALYCEIARMYEIQGDYQAALHACEETAQVLMGHPPGAVWARLQVRLGNVQFFLGHYAETERVLHAALPGLEAQHQDEERAAAYNILGNIRLMYADLPAARQQYEQSLVLYEAQRDLWGMAYCYNSLGNVCWGAGQLVDARGYYEESLTLREQMGDAGGAGTAYSGLASVYWQMGNLQEAWRCVTMARQLSERVGRIASIVLAYISEGDLLETEGDFAAALAIYQRAHLLAQQSHSQHLIGRTALGLGLVQLQTGDMAAVQAALQAWQPTPSTNAELVAIWLLLSAEFALAVGQVEMAAGMLAQAVAAGQQHGARYLWCRAERLLGDLALRQDDPAGGLAHGQQALALALALPAQLEHALTLDLLARCYATDPSLAAVQAALAHLAEAVTLLEDCGPNRYLTPTRRRLAALRNASIPTGGTSSAQGAAE